MAENSGIEWTDHTWTPIVGCDPVSPACANCYAALMAARLEAMGMEKYAGLATRQGNRGKWTGEVRVWEPDILAPLAVKKPTRWFLTSMGDVFHERVPFDVLDRLFAVMALTPQHTFYVLTKRPEQAFAYLTDQYAYQRVLNAASVFRANDGRLRSVPISNPAMGAFWRHVLIGGAVEDQQRADERRPHMRAIAAMGWRTFVSYEPALGPVDWSGWESLSWLISGGESGPHARPSHPDWHRKARDFCADRDIPYMFKQWGEHAPAFLVDGRNDGSAMVRVGKKAAGHLLDGVEHLAVPGVGK